MPLVEYYFPQALSPARLDRFLAGGWFRSGASLFRSKVLCLEGGLYSVINIRVDVEKFRASKSLRRLLKRNHHRFRLEFGKAEVNDRKEQLYQTHKHRFKGFIFESLEEFLFTGQADLLFDMHELRMYDGDLLVGVSYFDKGQQGIASIMGLYDQEYAAYSLGIYSMLQEVLLAQRENKRFYYPGYILRGHPGFDYKMRLGHIQYYNWKGRWCDINKLSEEYTTAQELDQALRVMEKCLVQYGVSFTRRLYPFFLIAYLGLKDHDFMGSAAYIWCFPDQKIEDHLIIEYSIDTNLYVLSWASPQHDVLDYSETEFSQNFFNEKNYMKTLLAREDVLLKSASPDAIAQQVRRISNTFLSYL